MGRDDSGLSGARLGLSAQVGRRGRTRTSPAVALALTVGALAAVLIGPGPVAAQDAEEILSYDVLIDVRDGNRMAVTEEITVRSQGMR
ncbi:MAG: hypothetical protein HKO98_16055, partial [Gemmatimonadetes bacterium]|nr:hypothetical protein [Gemmatimonadota bacterium]